MSEDKVEVFTFRGIKPLVDEKLTQEEIEDIMYGKKIEYAMRMSGRIERILKKIRRKNMNKMLIYENTFLYVDDSLQCFSDMYEIVFLTKGGFISFSCEDTIKMTITTERKNMRIELELVNKG